MDNNYKGPGNVAKAFQELRELGMGKYLDETPSCPECGMPEHICRCPDPDVTRAVNFFLNGGDKLLTYIVENKIAPEDLIEAHKKQRAH